MESFKNVLSIVFIGALAVAGFLGYFINVIALFTEKNMTSWEVSLRFFGAFIAPPIGAIIGWFL